MTLLRLWHSALISFFVFQLVHLGGWECYSLTISRLILSELHNIQEPVPTVGKGSQIDALFDGAQASTEA